MPGQSFEFLPGSHPPRGHDGGRYRCVARAAIEKGEAGLPDFNVQLFRPVQPMLAQTAEDVDDAMSELGEAALEYKMDGARVQVHRSGDDVMVYSRGMNDVTAAVAGDRGSGAGASRKGVDPRRRGAELAAEAGRSRFRSRCAASAASWMWSACGRSCR